MLISNSQTEKYSIFAKDNQTTSKKSTADSGGDRGAGGDASFASGFQAFLTETQNQVAGGDESSTVRNPIDYMTSTDIALWESVTGGTIEGGKAYLPDGTEGNTEAGSDLIEAIYEMRAHGTFDSLGNRVALSGDISVEDMQGYIDHYRPGGWVSSDTHVLDLALTELTTD